MDEGWQKYVEQISICVETKEQYQRILGKTASEIVTKYGNDAILKLADEVLNSTGRTISPTTLRNYKWVWEKTSTFNLPEDLSYRCLQSIAGSANPDKYVQLIKEGASSSEIIREIRIEKGYAPKQKTFVCSSCGAENSIK